MSNPNAKPPKGKLFKKGVSGNPKGRPPHLVPYALRTIGVEQFREMIELAINSNTEGLRLLIKDPATSAIQMGIATSLLKAIQKGDWTTLEAIVSRIIGKMPDEVNVNAKSVVVNVDPAIVRATMEKLNKKI